MQGFRITGYKCDDDRAYVTFVADGKEYTQKFGMGEGRKLYDEGDREKNRPKIQRDAVGLWLSKNWELVSKPTYEEMKKFKDSR